MSNYINGTSALKIVEFPKKVEQPKKERKTNNYKVGEKQEVYPFKSKEDLNAMHNYFVEKGHYRDDLMFILGINVGLRAGDLLALKWNQILREDKTINDGITVKEEKTGKFRTFYLNDSCKKAIESYYKIYIKEKLSKKSKLVKAKMISMQEFNELADSDNFDMDSYVFASQKGKHIQTRPACNIIKTAAKAVGIEYNVGTHSLRKTFGYHQLKAHTDDALFLCELQEMFGHSSPKITLRYCGLEGEKIQQYYNDVNLL